jgi:hypothetical protein
LSFPPQRRAQSGIELEKRERVRSLGTPEASHRTLLAEDKDNQIDIVLGGDERAVARITAVEIPARGRYSPFYNPGGPGNDPTPGVRYTAPGPSQTQPVLNALKDPMQVTFIR